MAKKEISEKRLRETVKGTHTKRRTVVPGELITRVIDGIVHQGEVMDTTWTTTTTTTTTYGLRDPRSKLILTKEQLIRKKYNFPVNIKFKEKK
ncbi:MAG: hypothetical protein GY750_03830 [Lentisphaerae bacterium]|nr:hypothetical protein [Lentisphaerota bacterium]MCP4100543.1 hypothetical protein [Lentisphaerota bacterium]